MTKTKALLFTLAFCLACGPVAFAGDTFTLYLARHAEKQTDGSRDPALTAAGERRSESLAAWLQDKGVGNIWSSDYRRTRDTALPLAGRLGLGLNLYDPGNPLKLVGYLLGQRHTSLVVGHSNTIPELARILCECDIADMDENEYDRLIVITVDGGQVRAETLDQDDLL